MCYDPANITIVGAIKLPKPPTLQEAIRAQREMSRAEGPEGGGWDQWFLRTPPSAPPPPPAPARCQPHWKARFKND